MTPTRPFMRLVASRTGTLSALILIGVALTLAGARPEERRDAPTFILPDDLEITLWAESPLFYNPTNIDVDARGRVWVTEAVNYRDFNNKDGHRRHEAGDRVVILEDTDQDGKADQSKVFTQDPDLRSPLGIAVLGERVVVSSAPNLIVYTDRDGDDRPDGKEKLLTGFGGFDHDHSLHALVAGPDGDWYFNTGNAGPHVVTDRSGWTLRSGSQYTGGTPYNLENQGGMTSDDGRVYVGGLALRVRPDGTGLKVLAHNFRNAYELAVDSYGNLWQNDNDDQVMTTRTTWLMEGGNAGYFSADGTRNWQADRRPGQDAFTAHWHQEDPGVIPAGDNAGAGSPAGILLYESDALGPKYRGMLLSAEAGRNVIFAYWPKPQGAGYALERHDLITPVRESTENYVWDDIPRDTTKWFRPSDVAVGPDGALYIADWFDPVVGGHRMDDRRGYGRIYRVTPKGRKLTTPKLDLSTTEGQIRALLSPAVNVRSLGYERLKAQGEAAVAPVRALLSDPNPYHRARAVWLLADLGPSGITEVERLLASENQEIRITAFRALRKHAPDRIPFARLAIDPSPAVRREVALALRGVPLEQSKDLILTLARGYNGRDRWYLEALGLAAEGHETEIYEALARDAGAPETWDDRMASLAWRLHSASALPALTARAESPTLTPEARRQALTAIGFIETKEAAQAMADLTHSDLPDVAEQASWWMQYRTTNTWRDHPVEGWSVVALSTEARPFAELNELHEAVMDEDAFITRRMEAAEEMAKDPQGGLMLVADAKAGRMAYQVRWGVAAGLYANPDPTVRYLARYYFDPPGGARPAYDAARIAALPAERERGQQVFFAGCASCHKAGDVGGDVGPDLTAIRAKFDRTALVDQIVRPGEAVVFGYEPWLMRLADGRAAAGFLLSDGEVVVLKDASGQRHTFDKADIVSREQLNVTLMPDPHGLALSEQDVADVAEYLLKLE